jgi:tetratricopeptide (TPR) repeat protein
MSDVSSRRESPLPLSLARRINEVCNRFELAWQAGPRPHLEDFVGNTPEPERSALLRELIALDLDYRRQAGEKPTAEEYRERFPALAPPAEVSTVLDSTSPPDGAADLSPVPDGATQAGRYQLGEEIGHGGMGAVLQGHDPELDRDLAIKVLREDLQDQPDAVQRFLAEARIAGRLQHPGVVPVYDLGRFPDRRPFFAMKLVQGCTLADLLKERPDPAHDLPRFLKIFEQVCQTLAYAHSKGVIHRDLKPSNIMVGAFGEVQVMDWGVAKLLTRWVPQPSEPASGASTLRGEPTPSLTRVGQVMGTPGYMAPEQARGEVEKLDERCDVFGLGAILCVILTGKPPYRGERGEVLRRAQQADQADALARLDRCGADAQLVRLAKTCLQPQAEDRPRHAGAVAEQVTAYLVGVQERLQQAEMERAAAQAREEQARARAEAEGQARRAERRARQRTLTLAATILVFVLLAGGGWLWVEHERQTRSDETIRAVNLALGKVEQLRQQAEQTPPPTLAAAEQALTLWQQARAALAQAEAVLATGEADATTQERVAALRAAVETGSRRAEMALAQARREERLLADLDEARLARSQATSQGPYLNVAASAAAYEQAFTAFGLEVLRLPEAEAAKRIRGLRPELRTAVILALDDWAFCVGDQKVRERLRQEASGADDDAWRRDFRKAKDRSQLEVLTVEALSRELPASSLYLLAAALLGEGIAERAEVVLRRAMQLHPADFWVHFELGGLLEKRGQQDPVAVLEERVGHLRAAVAARPQSAPAHNNLGVALYDKKDLEGAIASYRQALKLDPKHARADNNLGNALKDKGDVKGAMACYRKALALDPKYALAHYNLGTALYAKKDLEGAIACFHRALALEPKLAWAHNGLGVALQAQGDLKGAMACYTKALTLDPKLVQAHADLGNALVSQGDLKGAIACYKKALTLDPKYAPAHTNLGTALYEQGDLKGAMACYRKALGLAPKDATAHYNLGQALYDQGEMKGAIACYHKTLDLDPKYAKAHNNLGLALQALGDLKGAIACYNQALDLDPKYAKAHYNLGNALSDQKDVTGAIACYKKALALDPKYAKAYSNLGVALRAEGDLKGAIACFKQALALDPKYVLAHFNLGNALAAQKDWKGAIACYRKALDLDPKDAKAHNNLGQALQAQGDLQGAMACYQKALDLDPKHVQAHHNLGLALQAQGDLKGAIACYHKALALDPKYAKAHNNLGTALQAQGDVQGAIACYKKALTLDPKLVQAHGALGQALLAQGAFAEARAATQQALKLLPEGHPLRKVVTQQLQRCQRLLDLDARLTAILAGDDQPKDTAERIEFAEVCQYKRFYAASARFFKDAFVANPKLAEDPTYADRYHAACSATLAGCGQGEDAVKPDPKERTSWRKQALDWLSADLAMWSKQLDTDKPEARARVRQTLQSWQYNLQLAGVRDEKALAKLPEAEQQAWRQLWTDVAALLKRAAEQK